MFKKMMVLSCLFVIGCSSPRNVRDPVPREVLCRSISRDLNLNRTSALGIENPSLVEQNRLMQEYQRNHCEDFEEN